MGLEEKIRELEDAIYCYKQILRHVNEGVLFTDRHCRIAEFNPAKEKMEHLRAEDVLGKLSWDAYDRSNEEISEHKRVFDTGEPIVKAYRPHAYVGDVPVYIYYSTYPVIRNGEVLGVYSISTTETLLRELLYETIEHKRRLRGQNGHDSEDVPMAKGTHFTFADIIGNSAAMKALIRDAQTVAPLNMPILITGETGTGKEVLAQSIHNFGREQQKFVAINCAAIPENLVESVLFGVVKGAYTGAVESIGLFREAEGGTLFLDEINSMSTELQAKLLRALQEQCVRPVGSLKEYPIRCRLICASNENPDQLIREKRLRQDLFYRISGFCLSIPPLRERREDLLDMVSFFVRQYNGEFNKNVTGFTPELAEWIAGNDWPGNIREMQNVAQNMMLRCSELTRELGLRDLPAYARGGPPEGEGRPAPVSPPVTGGGLWAGDLPTTLDRFQRVLIEDSLREHGGNISRAAEALGIGRQNLSARMRRLGIRREEN